MTDQLPTSADPDPAPAAAASAAPEPAPPPAAPPIERLNLPYHVIIGIAAGVVAVFTAYAWIPAILTGIVIGRASVEQRKGIRPARGTQVLRVLAVTGGVLAMLVLGAVIGGLIAFFVAALASFSERVAANTGPIDQTMARIIIGLVTTIVWFAAIYVIGLNLNISIGG
jgi:hypothetical protein